MQEVQGFIILLDISGYTRFIRSHNLRYVPGIGAQMKSTSEAHAEQIITDLLETLIKATHPLLNPEKLEGDAVLMTAMGDDDAVLARELMDALPTIFDAFHKRIHELAFCNACLCDCCSQMVQLRVKAIAHHGPFLLKKVLAFREIAGQEVIRAHRLLKNDVDSDEYLMITDAVSALLGGNHGLPMTPHREHDPDLGETKVWVHQPDPPVFPEPLPTSYLTRYKAMKDYFGAGRTREGLLDAIP